MDEISTAGELASRVDGDLLQVWAGQGDIGGRSRAWYSGDAVVVAAADLSKHDRLVVRGPLDELAPLVERLLAELGPTYRPFGEESVIRELVDRVPGLSVRRRLAGWRRRLRRPRRPLRPGWKALPESTSC